MLSLPDPETNNESAEALQLDKSCPQQGIVRLIIGKNVTWNTP